MRCKSRWLVFAGSVQAEVEIEEAPLNEKFVELLTERLASLDIPVSITK